MRAFTSKEVASWVSVVLLGLVGGKIALNFAEYQAEKAAAAPPVIPMVEIDQANALRLEYIQKLGKLCEEQSNIIHLGSDGCEVVTEVDDGYVSLKGGPSAIYVGKENVETPTYKYEVEQLTADGQPAGPLIKVETVIGRGNRSSIRFERLPTPPDSTITVSEDSIYLDPAYFQADAAGLRAGIEKGRMYLSELTES